MSHSQDPEYLLHRRALLGGAMRALDLRKRVPELLRRREWPADPDLCAVLAAAVALTAIGAGATLFNRPASAVMCAGTWAEDDARRASVIVEAMDLRELTEPA